MNEDVLPEKHLSLEHGPNIHFISAGAKAHSHSTARSINSPSSSVHSGGGLRLEAFLTGAVDARTSALCLLHRQAAWALLGRLGQTSTPDCCCPPFLPYYSLLPLGFEVLCGAPAPNLSSTDSLHSLVEILMFTMFNNPELLTYRVILSSC